MKRFIYSLSFAALVALVIASCGAHVIHGKGKKSTEIPSVAAFNAVDVNVVSDVNITVTEGSAYGVELSGYENILKHIKTEVKDGTLSITYDLDDTWNIDDEDTKIRISVPSLTALSLSGAPDVDVMGSIKGDAFKLDISGAGDVTIDNINTNKLDADLSGVAALKVKGGMVKMANYDISGAGKIEAFALQTEETTTSISGAGKSEVWASGKLTADISGAGSVKYKGSPQVEKSVSGVGSVSQEN